jgi:hypothetical protein
MQLAVLLEPSVAVNVTGNVPTGTVEPGMGDWVTVTPPH